MNGGNGPGSPGISRKRFLTGAAALAGAGTWTVRSGVASAQSSTGRFNLRDDFGGVGDGSADDGPALQRALDALGANGGGELEIPTGRFAIASPVFKDLHNLASAIHVVGHGSSSQLVIKVGVGKTAITLANLQDLVIRGVTFAGTAGVPNDAAIAIAVSYCNAATFSECNFYGLSCYEGSDTALILATFSDLLLERCPFRGCAAGAATVVNRQWIGFRCENGLFIDHGEFNGEFVTKTGFGGGLAWIQALQPAVWPVASATSQGLFAVRHTRFDEGMARAVQVSPGTGRIERARFEGVEVNAHSAGIGLEIVSVESVVIDQSYIGYTSTPVTDAIRLSDVTNALISRTFCLQQANRITADAACDVVELDECTYTTLDSQAALTIVTKNGDTTRTQGTSGTTTTTTTTTTTSTTAPSTTTTTTTPPGSGKPFVSSFTPYLPRNNFSGWVGFVFRVGAADIRVSSLGRWVVAGNSRTHAVKLVNAASGMDVPGTSVTVATSGAPAATFKYTDLPAPVTLPAGGLFYLVSEESSGGDVWYDWDTRIVTAPEASSAGVVYLPTGGTKWVTNGGAGNAFVPPNFLFG